MSEQQDHGAPTPANEGSAEGPKVVVGFDNSPPARRALNAAAAEAARRGVALEILCGWPWEHAINPAAAEDPETLDRVRRHLDEAAARVRRRYPQVPVTPSVTADAAHEALLRCGRDAVLTVVGTRGHGGFKGLLLGSVSLRVAAQTTCPLLVVGPGEESGGQDQGRVLVGMKSDADTEALEYALAEAERRGAELKVLHTWQFSPYPEDIHDTTAAGTLISETVRERRGRFPTVDTSVDSRQERAAGALVEASSTADVLVLTVHRRKRRFGLWLGPVTHALLSHSRCPVVLLPVGT